MFNYEVIKLNGQGQFDLNGVRFAGRSKSFMFWKKKSTLEIRQVVVIFDKEYENVPVNDGVVVLSLKGLTNYQDLYEAIKIFIKIIDNDQVKFQFIVDNESKREIAEELGKSLVLSMEVHDVRKKVVAGDNNKVNEVEKNLQANQTFTASGSKTLEVQNDTGIKKVTINDEKAYENVGMLSIEEQKYLLLQEWKKDPFMVNKLAGLTEGEIDRLLMDNVTSNLTEYRMESALEQSANNKVGEVARTKALAEGGLVNTELGVIQNDVSNSNEYSAIETRGEGVQIVNSAVTTSAINTTGISNISSDVNEVSQYVESSLVEDDYSSREVVSEFYIDEEFNIYDKEGEVLGKIGQAGYMIDYADNSLTKNGQKLGFIGDYNDLGKNKANVYYKSNVRTLKKDDNRSQKSAAFISLPVIMFVLSALLLVSSLVLLFVFD